MRGLVAAVLLAFAVQGMAQQSTQRRVPATPSVNDGFLNNGPVMSPTSLTGADYRIGRDDLIDVSVFEVPDLGITTRVSATGMISLPLVGPLQASGKTVQELETSIQQVLKAQYVNDPHVTVLIREYASQPVSVMGAVKLPGIYQIKGQKYLLDMLAQAQGVDQMSAGKTIQIMRRKKEGEAATTIEIDAVDLLDKGKTELNIPVEAGDVINVLHAGSVFVIGEVSHGGEFILKQGKDVTAAQAVALAGGTTQHAKKKGCSIIRVHPDGTKEEIPVNIEKILDGSLGDVAMVPNDILFVPSNKVKTGVTRALDTTLAIVSGRLIYGF